MEASCSRKRKRSSQEDAEEDTDQLVDEINNIEKVEEQNYHIAIEAQEPATTVQYDDIQVTPFNLEDELEEGEFDKAGNFIFGKKENLDESNNDTWAESIDWSRVENSAPIQEREKSPDNEPEPVVNPIECYKNMLRIMRADETVQRTIRRLGNGIPKRRPNKNKLKEPEAPDVAETRQNLDLMIEFAHKLLENGDVDVYQKSYEDLEEAING